MAASERGAGGMPAAPLIPLSDSRGGKRGSDVVCGNRLIAAQHHGTGCDYDKMRRPNMRCYIHSRGDLENYRASVDLAGICDSLVVLLRL